jgi:tRNA-dihydrouridine synthase
MVPLSIHFAPLQGYTEAPYRNAHAEIFGGVDFYYTPFVRVDGGELRKKDVRDASPESDTTGCTVPQLIANSAEKAEKILEHLTSNGVRRVDINMGCPFPMLARRGNGSGILPHPEAVESLLSVVKAHPEVDFSIKMRLGWEGADECMDLLPMLNDTPLTHITMHPRLGRQQYKGQVDLEAFGRFADGCRHAVIYNGDILTTDDMRRIAERFPKVGGLMIGRGLLSNPALALEWKSGKRLSPADMANRLSLLHQSVRCDYEQRIEGGDKQLLAKLKPFWEYLEPLIGHKAAKAIFKSQSLGAYDVAVGNAIYGMMRQA